MFFTLLFGLAATAAPNISVNAISTTQAKENPYTPAASQTAVAITKVNDMQTKQPKHVFKVGQNANFDAMMKARAEKAKALAQAKAQKAAKAKAQAQQQQAQKAAKAKAQKAAANTASATSTTDKGTFKLSFYDPAVLGSGMGYSGVAANLSIFPKGTRLKITLSDGTVWYRTVNDTGTFAAGNSKQLDVAMPNSQIPSAGVLTANVQVVD